MLKALSLVDKKVSEPIRFIWIGYNGWGNNMNTQVKSLMSQFSFNKIEIELIPSMSRKEIAKNLQMADLFVLSSISEGMPVSVMEALACGLPVISTRCGGVDELINDGNGGLVQIKDYQAISDFILNCTHNKTT